MGAQGGEGESKKKKKKGSSFLAINCVFLIKKKKGPHKLGSQHLERKEEIMTPFEKVPVASALGS